VKRLGVHALLVASLGVTGCEPSPETFGLSVKSGQSLTVSPMGLPEGDVLVIEATPRDDDADPMELCVRGASSNPEIVEVRRVQGKCRLFIISATKSGAAVVTFSARDHDQSIAIDVTPLPAPR
jgi:hypothetical protein